MLANETIFTSAAMVKATPAAAADVRISVNRYIKNLLASGSNPV